MSEFMSTFISRTLPNPAMKYEGWSGWYNI